MTKTDKHLPISDLWLVRRVKRSGDRGAFGELVERYQSPLRRYLTHLTGGDRFRADDLAQECFIKAFTSIGQFSGLGSFRAWLFRIAYRTFLDNRRSVHPTQEIERTEVGEENPAEIAILHSALACLDDTERNVILLSAVEQLSHSQIAHVAEMPLGTVKSVVARAKAKLREYLKNEEL
ncbi:RNA polymerase sigma factor [uncultured Rikenella sp.]|uniref:RNA polymerase sigma factor n=1 Tax=uncultured Rikenella sp. TaxID=368003 RepID=UPI00261DBA8C|nr:RNA polymerase sigma factor [uncultured Rikenella sp.]